jgi:predicted ATPase
LAIELAARRVGVFGLHETVALLDRSLARLWVGPRTAPPRQRTLQATLDWSYGLLSELERIVLRRLAVFVGHFTLDAALAVAISERVDAALVFGAIDSLVAKSMLATRPLGAMMRYRLLDTTRAYVLEFEGDGAELASMAVRHATYYRQWLEQHGAEWPTLATGIERTAHFAAINNVRAALEWCFGRDGDVKTGVGLAAAAAPVLVAMSLLSECLDWSERAVLALDDDARGGFQEMQLQGALGVSLIFTRGAHEAAQVPLMRSLAIAEDRGDRLHQVRQLGSLAALHQRNGEFNIALEYARRCSELARPTGDFAAIALAHSTLGLALHCVGELGAARLEFEAALAHRPSSRRTRAKFFGIESYILANTMLARNLWLQGHPAQAIEQARRTVEEALRTDHSLLISAAFIGVIPVFLLTGDLLSAGDYIDTAIPHAETHSFGPYLWVGRGFKGEIAIRQGDAAGGVETLKSALRKLHEARYELFTTPLNISLIQGLATLGQFDDGIALADETVRQVELNGRYGNMAEALRVKGGLLLLMGQPGSEAEMCFAQSLEVSRRQGARGWELRTAIDLASLWATQGRSDDARTLLRPVFEQFVDGFATADLQSAERLLARLS